MTHTNIKVTLGENRKREERKKTLPRGQLYRDNVPGSASSHLEEGTEQELGGLCNYSGSFLR